MLKTLRTRLVVGGLASLAMAAASIAMAQDNSSSATPSSQSNSSIQSEGVQSNAQSAQPGATNSSSATTGTKTEQQAQAPVADPQAAAQDAAQGKSTTGQAAVGAAGTGQNANANGNTQEWPAPQRYQSGRGAGDNTRSGSGRASLGVNVVGTEDGQGVMVARIRPGTPADQMGLRPRDRILTLNGQAVGSVDEFIAAIRGMNVGDQIQLSIDRGGNASDVGGRLEAFREAVAVGEGPVGNILGRAHEIIRDRGDRLGVDGRTGGENQQTSYEERSLMGRQSSGDIEARLTRLEQQLDRLTQTIEQIRNSQNTSSSQSGTPGGAGRSGTNSDSNSPIATPGTSTTNK